MGKEAGRREGENMRICFSAPCFQKRLSFTVILLLLSVFLLTAFQSGDRMHSMHSASESVCTDSKMQLSAGSTDALPETDNRQIFSALHGSVNSFAKLVRSNVGGSQNRLSGRTMRVLFSFFMFAFCIESAGLMLSLSGDGLRFMPSSQDISEKISSFRLNN